MQTRGTVPAVYDNTRKRVEMPPYQAVTSKAQSRKLFVLEAQGKLKPGEAAGKTKAADYRRLPQHVKHTKHEYRRKG